MRTEKMQRTLERFKSLGMPVTVALGADEEVTGHVDWVGQQSFDLTHRPGIELARVQMVHLALVPSET